MNIARTNNQRNDKAMKINTSHNNFCMQNCKYKNFRNVV